MKRSKFLKTSLVGGTSMLRIPSIANSFRSELRNVKYELALDSPAHYFDGKTCFSHSRAGIVPQAGENGMPRVIITMSLLNLSGSDIFAAMYGMQTDDLGKTWTHPQKLDNLGPHHEVIGGEKRFVALSDFWPHWHKNSKNLLGTGQTVVYIPDKWKIPSHPRSRHTTYSFYNSENNTWSEWQKLKMPDKNIFYDWAAGSTQRYDKTDGTILLPVGFHARGKNGSVTVTRCSLYGKTLRYLEHGNEISIDDDTRGLYEPSLTFFKGEYFLTIRHDKRGYVARSGDGLHFSPIQPWKFDDGTDLGSYNTQQHWVTHSNGLFLVYTRRGANNDNVFRNRAPLFMAQIDPKQLCVRRETEQILVPNRGARLGNFGITDVGPHETWVTVAEWMQPKGVEKYGSDGSIWVAKIHWNKPNLYFIN